MTPFLLRTVAPPVSAAEGRRVVQLRRIGKRICVQLDGDLWLVLHLMIAGRFHWREGDSVVAKLKGLALFQFENGALFWTEAGSSKRASFHVVAGEEGFDAFDPGGLEIMQATFEQFI